MLKWVKGRLLDTVLGVMLVTAVYFFALLLRNKPASLQNLAFLAAFAILIGTVL